MKRSKGKKLNFLRPSQAFLDDPSHFIENISKAAHAVFNEILRYDVMFSGATYPSQITIAKNLNLSRTTVNHACRFLKTHNLIKWYQRWNNSCVYTVSFYLKLPDIRQKLKKYLPSLSMLSLVMILSMQSFYSKKLNTIRRKDYMNSYLTSEETLIIVEKEYIRTDIYQLDHDYFEEKKLSLLGQVYLLAFDPKVIKAVKERLSQRLHKGDDQYSYFYRSCKNYSTQNGYDIDKKTVAIAGNRLKLSSTDSVYSSNVKISSPQGYTHMIAKVSHSNPTKSQRGSLSKPTSPTKNDRVVDIQKHNELMRRFQEEKTDNVFINFIKSLKLFKPKDI